MKTVFMKSAICEYCNKSFKISGISRHRKACANRSTNQIAMPQNPEYDKLLEKVKQLEAERSEVRNKVIEEVLEILNESMETTDADAVQSYFIYQVEKLKK